MASLSELIDKYGCNLEAAVDGESARLSARIDDGGNTSESRKDDACSVEWRQQVRAKIKNQQTRLLTGSFISPDSACCVLCGQLGSKGDMAAITCRGRRCRSFLLAVDSYVKSDAITSAKSAATGIFGQQWVHWRCHNDPDRRYGGPVPMTATDRLRWGETLIIDKSDRFGGMGCLLTTKLSPHVSSFYCNRCTMEEWGLNIE